MKNAGVRKKWGPKSLGVQGFRAWKPKCSLRRRSDPVLPLLKENKQTQPELLIDCID